MSNYQNQLKPCPWCGKKVDWHSADHYLFIECQTCNYRRNFEPLVGFENKGKPIGNGLYYYANAQEDAVKAWNKRFQEKTNETD